MGDIEIKIKGDMAMKLFFKKRKDKGFSLVELIVVVAIMAVLIGVLVPTLVRNVEKSRLSKDKSALDEVKNAVEIALADEEYMDTNTTYKLCDNTDTVTIGNASDATLGDFWKEVQANLGETSIKLGSKLKGTSEITLTIADGHATIICNSSEAGDYTFSIPEGEVPSSAETE